VCAGSNPAGGAARRLLYEQNFEVRSVMDHMGEK
jgi:hypothetical protein